MLFERFKRICVLSFITVYFVFCAICSAITYGICLLLVIVNCKRFYNMTSIVMRLVIVLGFKVLRITDEEFRAIRGEKITDGISLSEYWNNLICSLKEELAK